MGDEVIKISDGDSHLRITDPKLGVITARLTEIGSGGAHSSLTASFDANAYLDVTIALKGQPPRQFFANVVSSGAGGLRVAWMHIDPGEQARLKGLLDAYRSGAAAGTPRTRRILKPSSPAESTPEITPFAESAAPSGRVGTRRVLKPSAPSHGHKNNLVLDEGDLNEESRLHQVVLASTDKFIQMKDLSVGEDEPPAVPASTAAPVVPSPPAMAEAPEAEPTSAQESEPEAVDEKARMIVGQDGRMDIGASIRNKAKTVRASELAARHDKVRVLNMATIKALIQDAVEEAANHLTRALGEADRKRLLEEAEESFQERLKAFQLEKADADERARKLHEQLASAQRLLEEERKRTISADQFTVSAAGMDELEAKFKRMVDRSAAEGKVSESLLDELRKAASHVLDEERARIREKEMQVQNDKIALLEKKISRLAGNLDEAERQRDEARHIAQALEANSGSGPVDLERIKNKYKTGLDKDDPKKAAKLAAMKELMDANRELRKQLGLAVNAPVAPKPADTSAPAPAPVPVAPPAAPVATSSDASGTPEVNPDDEPWVPDESPVSAPVDDDGMVGGVKRIRVAPKPPPALVATPPADEAPDINPDDEIWAPPEEPAAGTTEADDDGEAGGVKKIKAFKNFAPPPLQSR